jgi:hypothetical protein
METKSSQGLQEVAVKQQSQVELVRVEVLWSETIVQYYRERPRFADRSADSLYAASIKRPDANL